MNLSATLCLLLQISKLELEVDSFDTAAVTNILDIVMQCLVEELVAEKKDGHSGMKFSRTTLRVKYKLLMFVMSYCGINWRHYMKSKNNVLAKFFLFFIFSWSFGAYH